MLCYNPNYEKPRKKVVFAVIFEIFIVFMSMSSEMQKVSNPSESPEQGLGGVRLSTGAGLLVPPVETGK